mgnify:CR=1 FL=1
MPAYVVEQVANGVALFGGIVYEPALRNGVGKLIGRRVCPAVGVVADIYGKMFNL